MGRFALVFVVLAVGLVVASVPVAEVPYLVNYQGILTDSGGEPLDGQYDLTFKIYPDSLVATPALWTEEHPDVDIDDGLFNVILGGVTALHDSLFEGTERWLGITVDTDSEMSPRMRIASVPWAFRAAFSDTATVALNASSGDDSCLWDTDGTDVWRETGRVGIGTLDPERRLHIVGDNPRILIEAETVNPEVNFKHSGDASSDVWSIYKESGTEDLRFYQGGNKVWIQGGTGNVGIGGDPGTNKLRVNGTACGSSAWGICSDARLKRDIKGIDDALSKIAGLRGVSFAWKTDQYPEKGFDDGSHYGVIAQEVEEVLPEVVREGLQGEKAVAYSELIPVLIESIKQLKAENETLSERLAAVEGQLN